MKRFIEFSLALFMIFSTPLVKAQNEKSITDVHGIEIGVKAPVFTAIDAENKTFSLEKELEKGPIVKSYFSDVYG